MPAPLIHSLDLRNLLTGWASRTSAKFSCQLFSAPTCASRRVSLYSALYRLPRVRLSGATWRRYRLAHPDLASGVATGESLKGGILVASGFSPLILGGAQR
jgi:hypothetical protein